MRHDTDEMKRQVNLAWEVKVEMSRFFYFRRKEGKKDSQVGSWRKKQ